MTRGLVPYETFESGYHLFRGQKVILDRDLSLLQEPPSGGESFPCGSDLPVANGLAFQFAIRHSPFEIRHSPFAVLLWEPSPTAKMGSFRLMHYHVSQLLPSVVYLP